MAENPFADLFREYLNPRADRLFAKVDFVGLIRDSGRAAFLAFWTGMVAIVIAISEAFNRLVDALGFSFRFPIEGALAMLADVQRQAIGIAAVDLREFGILAQPVSAAVALATLTVAAVAVWFLWRQR